MTTKPNVLECRACGPSRVNAHLIPILVHADGPHEGECIHCKGAGIEWERRNEQGSPFRLTEIPKYTSHPFYVGFHYLHPIAATTSREAAEAAQRLLGGWCVVPKEEKD